MKVLLLIVGLHYAQSHYTVATGDRGGDKEETEIVKKERRATAHR